MNYRIEVSATFKKDIKHLGKRYPSIVDDYAHLLEELEANPNLIRMAIVSKGRGKSGGARVITFSVIISVEETEVNLLTIYDKSERESINCAEIEQLLEKNGLR